MSAGYWFPSEEWLAGYRENLNANETYREQSEGWGDGWNGDFVFEITNLPVDERTVGDLPDDLLDGFHETVRALDDGELDRLLESATDEFEARLDERAEGTDDDRERLIAAVESQPIEDVPDVLTAEIRETFPERADDLLDQLEAYVDDGTVYAYVALEDGECLDTEILTAPGEREPGFQLTARYPTWKELVRGADVIDSVMSRDMKLDGSITTILNYGEAAQEMGDTASRTETRFVF